MVSIKARIPELLCQVKVHSCTVAHNEKLLKIFKGGLLEFIEKNLGHQLSGQSYEQARMRIPPINVLQRIINKQSKIYAGGVSREVKGGNDGDRQLLSFYEEEMEPSRVMAHCNSFFNLFKNCLVEPYLSVMDPTNPVPSLRVWPASKFLAYSTSDKEPEKATGFILFLGSQNKEIPSKNGGKSKTTTVQIYKAVEADEFCYFDSDGDDITQAKAPGTNGVNELGRIPLVYINRDEDCVVPEIDTDVIPMTVLIPILLTDVNFAHMFSAFSIIYTMNLEDSGLVYSPNAVWAFKTANGAEHPGSIGTLDPHIDIPGSLQLVANEFGLWLNTKGIKPGAIGDVSASNFASGISKILDEMDTSEDRTEQVPYFRSAEAELWDLILNDLHPSWVSQGLTFKGTFSAGAKVITNFSEQIPLARRGVVLDEQIKELNAALTTPQRAMHRLNPELNETDIVKLQADIDESQGAKGSILTGLQVTSMIEIVQSVSDGRLPRESGIEMLIRSFAVSDDDAEKIMGPAGTPGFKPTSIPTPKPINQV